MKRKRKSIASVGNGKVHNKFRNRGIRMKTFADVSKEAIKKIEELEEKSDKLSLYNKLLQDKIEIAKEALDTITLIQPSDFDNNKLFDAVSYYKRIAEEALDKIGDKE